MTARAVQGMVVDSVPLYSEGLVRALHSLLRAKMQSFTQPAQALRALREHCPDLAVIGPDVNEAEAFALMRAATQQCPALKVVLISREAEDPLIQSDALRSGANACLLPEVALTQYVEVIQAVLANHQVFTRTAIQLAHEPLVLTARERDVLLRLAEHKTDGVIARELTLSVTTVRKHSHHIITKLRVHSRHAALRRAHRLGWLPPPRPARLPEDHGPPGTLYR